MCDISKKTDLKEVIVYKVCCKRTLPNNKVEYFSIFALQPIVLGKVKKVSEEKIKELNSIFDSFAQSFRGSPGGNIFMEGRVSGFEDLSNAIILKNRMGYFRKHPMAILEIKLGGHILWGDSSGIIPVTSSEEIDIKKKTFAGTKILSFREINT